MEVKFNQNYCRYLRRAVDQVQTVEQTQEVRLPDSMPDIGRILGAWGSTVIRSKEWRGGGMGVSGGVTAWVLYAPEDGSEPRSMEVWIPFQMKWEFPETQRDGFICVVPRLKGIDARSTSARKMIVRANISAWGRGLESVDEAIYSPQEIPEDVEVLTSVYPMELPRESGEKLFQIDEELEGAPPMDKILRYCLNPTVLEQKVMASRLVFRGKAALRVLYLSDGKVQCWDTEVPFSQYTDLDQEFGPHSYSRIYLMQTNLELENNEGRMQLKCGLAAQFVIIDRVMVELAEDAYSNSRSLELQLQQLELPTQLEARQETLQPAVTVEQDVKQIVDITCLCDCPQRRQDGQNVCLTVPGSFQVLFYDASDNLQCAMARFQEEYSMEADTAVSVDGVIGPEISCQAVPNQQGTEISALLKLDVSACARQGQRMVTGLELGECREPDYQRPSLILRRYSDAGLWAIAKECGSTMDAIRQANGLTGEPEQGRMLLIPVS